MKIIDKLIPGIFKSESSNRFLCKVFVEGEELECYLPSSSKLEPLIHLNGKKVLLTLNKGTNIRTKYSIFAVQHNRKYIFLNLNVANWVLEDDIRKNYCLINVPMDILKEKTIEGYKADFVIPDIYKTVFEAKSIISTRQNAVFPSVSSKRAIEQLNKIEHLIDLGWNAQYYFIALSPFVKNLTINPQYNSYVEQFNKCFQKGMGVKGLACSFINNEITITHKLNIKV